MSVGMDHLKPFLQGRSVQTFSGSSIEQPESAPMPSATMRRDRPEQGVRMAPSDG